MFYNRSLELTHFVQQKLYTHWKTILHFPFSLPDSSAGKESACNAGDPRLIPGSGRSAGEGIVYPLQCSWASLVVQLVKTVCNAGDLGLIPGVGRSPWEGNSYSLQYSALENSVDCLVHGVTKSRTQLRNFQSLTVLMIVFILILHSILPCYILNSIDKMLYHPQRVNSEISKYLLKGFVEWIAMPSSERSSPFPSLHA